MENYISIIPGATYKVMYKITNIRGGKWTMNI